MNNAKNWDSHEKCNWLFLFEIFSLERCQQFFIDMGVPLTIVEEPSKIVRIGREFHLAYSGDLFKKINQNSNHADVFSQALEETFDEITLEYDKPTSDQLYLWSISHVIDLEEIRNYDFWMALLRQVCNSPKPNNELKLDNKKINDICQLSKNYITPSIVRYMHSRIATAKLLPFSAWEITILHHRYELGGDKFIVDPIETLLFQVSNIILNHKTFLILNELKTLLSKNELDNLIQWGRNQSS